MALERHTVDDSPFIVKLAVRMLTAGGHAVESAPNGSAGLARLTAVLGTPDDFDVVLCDFQMPVRAGVLAAEFSRSSRIGIVH